MEVTQRGCYTGPHKRRATTTTTMTTDPKTPPGPSQTTTPSADTVTTTTGVTTPTGHVEETSLESSNTGRDDPPDTATSSPRDAAHQDVNDYDAIDFGQNNMLSKLLCEPLLNTASGKSVLKD